MGLIKDKLYPLLKKKESDLGIKNLKIISNKKKNAEEAEEALNMVIGSRVLATIKANNKEYIVFGNPESKALNEKNLKDLKEHLELNGVKVGEIKVNK